MQGNSITGAGTTDAHGGGFDRSAAITRSLLGYGVLVGPLYLVVGIGQALLRDGFDLSRHSLSVLANGPGGWVQVANFAVCGLMVIAAAQGIARVLAPTGRGTRWALTLYGVCLCCAAVFRADPVDGFPPGTPVGMSTSVSTMGMLHFVFGALGFTAFGVSALLAVRALGRRGDGAMARASLIAGGIILVGFYSMAIPGLPVGILGIWVSVVVGWAWLLALSLHLYRTSPDPRCA